MAVLRFSRHARDRMLDRSLDVADIAAALDQGETIDEYVDGSRLVLGRARDRRPVHLVVRDTAAACFVITIYEPDPARWDATLTRRIKP